MWARKGFDTHEVIYTYISRLSTTHGLNRVQHLVLVKDQTKVVGMVRIRHIEAKKCDIDIGGSLSRRLLSCHGNDTWYEKHLKWNTWWVDRLATHDTLDRRHAMVQYD